MRIESHTGFESAAVVTQLHPRGVLTIPAGLSVVRILPALNLSRTEAEEGLAAIESIIVEMAAGKENR